MESKDHGKKKLIKEPYNPIKPIEHAHMHTHTHAWHTRTRMHKHAHTYTHTRIHTLIIDLGYDMLHVFQEPVK